jgi:hypothetical protein
MIDEDGTSDSSAFKEEEQASATPHRRVVRAQMPRRVNGTEPSEQLPETPQYTPPNAQELTACQHAAIAAIIAGDTYTDVCKALGIDRKTLYDWRHQPHFAAELDAEVKALRESARSRLLSLAGLALDALRDVLLSHPKDAVVVSAARIVLDRLGINADLASGQASAAVRSSGVDGVPEEPRTIWLVDSDQAQELLSAQRQAEQRG